MDEIIDSMAAMIVKMNRKMLGLALRLDSVALPKELETFHCTQLVNCSTTTLPMVQFHRLDVSVDEDFSLYFATFVFN